MSIEKAIAIEMERGRPSGTATITIETAMEKKSKIFKRVSFERSSLSVNMSLQKRKRTIAANEITPAA